MVLLFTNKNVKLFFYQTANKNGKFYDNYVRNAQYFLEQISESADADFKASIDKKLRQKAFLYALYSSKK